MKIAVAGTGYVGLSIATLLAQHNEVVAVDVIPEKVEKINNRISPIQDEYIKEASEQMWSYRTLERNISSQYNVQRSTWQKQHITSFTQWTIDSLLYFHQLSPQHNRQ